MKQWIHVDAEMGIPWVQPIWVAYNEAESIGLVPEKPKELVELAIHTGTRLNMLPFLIIRLNQEAQAIFERAKRAKRSYVSEKGKPAYALEVPEKVKYEFLLDVDAFFFELNSCCELMRSFLGSILDLAGKGMTKKKLGLRFRQILEEAGNDTRWFEALDDHRNLFIHYATPYLAVDVTNPQRLDILIMKDNLSDFDDRSRFITLSDLDQISKGFGGAIGVVQEYVAKVLSRLVTGQADGR